MNTIAIAECHTIDRELSAAVQAQFRAIPKQCYWNAADAMRGRPKFWARHGIDPRRDLYYCEGFAIIAEFLPIEHGWLQTVDGRTIETTIAVSMAPAIYYPGIRVSRSRLDEYSLSIREPLPLFHHYGFGGARLREWRAASLAGWLHALDANGPDDPALRTEFAAAIAGRYGQLWAAAMRGEIVPPYDGETG